MFLIMRSKIYSVAWIAVSFILLPENCSPQKTKIPKDEILDYVEFEKVVLDNLQNYYFGVEATITFLSK